MTRRRQRIIEHVSGSGTLSSSRTSAPVEYDIHVTVDEIETMPDEWIEGLKDTRGNVVAENDFALIPLFDDTQLTLALEDGRRFDCSLTRAQGTFGSLCARAGGRGGLYKP